MARIINAIKTESKRGVRIDAILQKILDGPTPEGKFVLKKDEGYLINVDPGGGVKVDKIIISADRK